MKLRHKIAFGLCAFYLISVIGIAMNLHFCSGQLSSVKLTEKASCVACKPADNKKLVKNDSCSNNTQAKVSDKPEPPAEVDVPRNSGVAALFAPVIAEFLQDLMPGLFSTNGNKSPALQ